MTDATDATDATDEDHPTWQQDLRRFGSRGVQREFLIVCPVGISDQVRTILDDVDDLPPYEVIESLVCLEGKILVIDQSVFIYGPRGYRP